MGTGDNYVYDNTARGAKEESLPRIRERGEHYFDSYNGNPWGCGFGTNEEVSLVYFFFRAFVCERERGERASERARKERVSGCLRVRSLKKNGRWVKGVRGQRGEKRQKI